MTGALPAQAIAVTGMTCRFPGAATIEEYWHNLRNGVESIRFHTMEELRAEGVDDGLLDDPHFVPANGELAGSGLFDAAYFGYSPREAELMDPQHRLFLECAAEALEQANVVPAPGLRVAVVGGAGTSSYLLNNVLAHPELIDAAGPRQVALGNDKDYLATRVAYKLNLTGPAFTVQTACSTSLVATHLACRLLLTYEADVAVVGGATVSSPQRRGSLYTKGGIASPDGHCRAFDTRAEGLAAGSGVGVVVLRRLEDAVQTRDVIHATILGSAVNNDGAAKVGFTAPSVARQAEVITEALEIAEVSAATIGYVEAHGTATALGDPVEVAALTRAFRRSTRETGYCALGSVKTNFGHLDAAAGIASLIKAVLVVKHGEIPPSLHFTSPNPQIDFESSPFFVNTANRPWPVGAAPRRAGVSSFGLGGTNAHVVLQEPPPPPDSPPSEGDQLLLLSAKTPEALAAASGDLAGHLRRHPGIELADVAFTLQVGRQDHPYRRAVVANSARTAAELLDRKPTRPAPAGSKERPVVFMFPGVSAVHAGAARELYQRYAVFRTEVDACSTALMPIIGADLRDHLCAADPAPGAPEQEAGPVLSACATFTLSYALARLLLHWGLTPRAMVGHSLGEYVAACLSGVLGLEDALRLVALRYELLGRQPAGAMLSIPLPEAEVAGLLTGRLAVAARNAPSSTLVSGPVAEIDVLTAVLGERGVEPVRLPVAVATHSPMIEPWLEEFAAVVAGIRIGPPGSGYVSSLTGDWADPELLLEPAYWVRQLRETVRFADALETLAQLGDPILLEVGHGQALTALARMQDQPLPAVATMHHRGGPGTEVSTLLESLGQLWRHGIGLRHAVLTGDRERQRVRLPTYPFQRQNYWLAAGRATALFGTTIRPDHDPGASGWFTAPSWRREPAGAVGTVAEPVCRLVLAGRDELSNEVVQRLSAAGSPVAVVSAGERFTAEPGRYVIDPSRPQDYRDLLDALRTDGYQPQQIVHLWPTDATEDAADPVREFERAQRTGFSAVVTLVQALAESGIPAPMRLWLVTDGAHDVTGAEPMRTSAATLQGAARVLSQEYPDLRCHTVDLSLDRASVPSRAAGQLVGELLGGIPQPTVAFRGPHRWVPEYTPVRLRRTESSGLRQGGLYVITGGLDDRGAALASYLTDRYAAQVVVLEEALPAAPPGGVHLRTADVALAGSLRQVLRAVTTEFGPLDGVFHTVGLREDKERFLVRNADATVRQEQFRRRAYSTLALRKVLPEFGPRFCLVQSTFAAYLGGLGRVVSAGVNAFVDAVAHEQWRTSAVRWITSAWDDGTYDAAGGTAVDQSSPGTPLFGPDDVGEVVERLLRDTGHDALLVSREPLTSRFEYWVTGPAGRPVIGAGETAHPRPQLAIDYEKPRNDIEAALAEIWQEILGITPLGIHDDFFALGGHSLMGTQIVARLRRLYDVDFPLRDLFEAATIAKMAERVVQIQATAAGDTELEQLLAEIERSAGSDGGPTDGRGTTHGAQD